MEEKKSKITSCKFIKEWTGANGVIYYHEIELENRDKGQIGTKERLPDKIAVGQELTYTIESTPHGNKIKAVSTGTGGGYKGKPQRDPKEQMISFAMAYSRDLVVAGKIELGQMNQYFDKIYEAMISKL